MKLKGTFTNREIIAWGIIVGIFLMITELHWLGLAVGVVMSTFVVWTMRDLINAKYRIKPSIARLLARSRK